jgi:predicted transporter
MQTFIGLLGELGWGVTAGIALLLVGAGVFAFTDWGETKREKAKRLSRDAARKEAR